MRLLRRQDDSEDDDDEYDDDEESVIDSSLGCLLSCGDGALAAQCNQRAVLYALTSVLLPSFSSS